MHQTIRTILTERLTAIDAERDELVALLRDDVIVMHPATTDRLTLDVEPHIHWTQRPENAARLRQMAVRSARTRAKNKRSAKRSK